MERGRTFSRTKGIKCFAFVLDLSESNAAHPALVRFYGCDHQRLPAGEAPFPLVGLVVRTDVRLIDLDLAGQGIASERAWIGPRAE